MHEPSPERLLDFAVRTLPAPMRAAGKIEITPLAGDGSNRRIYRVQSGGHSAILAANPLPTDRSHPDENEGFLAVQDFLARRGVRVPALLGADPDAGLVLLEDLGDTRLYDLARPGTWREQAATHRLRDLYRQAIDALALMHASGDPRFDPEATPNPVYDSAFIGEWEAAYFHRELVTSHLGRRHDFDDIAAECEQLAREALAAPGNHHFMHRDYQSRNLMVHGEEIVVIDFQGARLGPPEYDLAAVLYDPYVAMPENVREEMIARYLENIAGHDDRKWRRCFLANAADRLMQALGAYGKLGGRLGRPGFLEYIPQALAHLDQVLGMHGDCPRLSALVDELRATGTA